MVKRELRVIFFNPSVGYAASSLYTREPLNAVVPRYAFCQTVSTYKALRGIGDTAASVPDDFFDTFFLRLKKVYTALAFTNNSYTIKSNLSIKIK